MSESEKTKGPVMLQLNARQIVVLRDVLQWYEPKHEDEPVDEQEELRQALEALAGSAPTAYDEREPDEPSMNPEDGGPIHEQPSYREAMKDAGRGHLLP